MDKTEWPTDAKLEALRSEGLLAYSRFSTRAIFSSLVLIFLAFGLPIFIKPAWLGFQKIMEQPGVDFEPSVLGQLVWSCVGGGLWILGVSSLGVILWSLLQTRFFVRTKNISLDLNRLKLWRGLRFSQVLGLTLSAGLTIGLGLVLGFLLWRLGLAGFGAAYQSTASNLPQFTQRFLVGLLPYVCVGLVCLGLLAWLTNNLVFKLKHRMSRQEIQQELAEND